ncbi:MAG: bifunctional phosphopantothenoylcysteine decarboxylase/phosphopantothenate--cysteine ligase CoaBC [Leadbetterella sp.]
MSLESKKILLAISGSIAAYKSAWLVRLLIKAGAEVKVILSESASEFVTPLTLGTLSKNPVITSFVGQDKSTWHNHVELGLWADLMVVAPATAHTLAKCAHGICDSILIASYLSCRCPVYFSPAMDLDMYAHFTTEESIEKLKNNGNFIIEPNSGELASGLDGKGRMAEPEEILETVIGHFKKDDFWKGKKILINAGPSQEDLDPVRFISNHSTGKMGFEIARVFSQSGANVTLIAGPVHQETPPGVTRINVRSADEMYTAMQKHHTECQVAIFSAAIADYKPSEIAQHKIKKLSDDMSIHLVKTVDIAATLGKDKKQDQIHVGFALETQNEIENAQSKLVRKNFDMIVLNSLQDKGAGFRYDTNKICILNSKGERHDFDLKNKTEVALDIRNSLKSYINAKN